MKKYHRDKDKKRSRNPYEGMHPYLEVKKINNNALKTWRNTIERCVLCGENTTTTREHLPPKSIYSETPSDVVVVRACSKCQKSPDREFSDFLASRCVQKGETESSKNLLKHREKQSKLRKPSQNYINHLQEKFKKNHIQHPCGKASPVLIGKWPLAFHDSIILKLVHGYYWLLMKGKVLSDEAGKLIIVRDFNPNTKDGNFLVSNAFPSINIGNNQFICTHVQGFEKPYDFIVSMGFHFHTDNNSNYGYHVLVILCIEKMLSITSEHEKNVKEMLDEAPVDSIYDIKDSIYESYPY